MAHTDLCTAVTEAMANTQGISFKAGLGFPMLHFIHFYDSIEDIAHIFSSV